ncbi:MAG TPA: transposase family protein [Planctomycetota bacterium]|nr:transposase family protein [Planctomycetota bacterium]
MLDIPSGQAHAILTEERRWLAPGTVWAADFAEPPNPVDGLYEQILAARDLGSSYQIHWLPTPTGEARHACDALGAAFRQRGAPLVAKSDNGSPFISGTFQSLLERWNVVALLSPPYTPWYNGAIEAGIGSNGTRTHYEAARHGHPGYWTSDDLEAARLQSNTTARPWGARGPTPQALWTQRPPITPDERQLFRYCLEHMHAQVLRELDLSTADLSDGDVRAVVARAATRRALETLGYLCVRRKRITPPFNSHLRHIIT